MYYKNEHYINTLIFTFYVFRRSFKMKHCGRGSVNGIAEEGQNFPMLHISDCLPVPAGGKSRTSKQKQDVQHYKSRCAPFLMLVGDLVLAYTRKSLRIAAAFIFWYIHESTT